MVLIPFNRLEVELVKYYQVLIFQEQCFLSITKEMTVLHSGTRGLKEAREKDKFLLRRKVNISCFLIPVSTYHSPCAKLYVRHWGCRGGKSSLQLTKSALGYNTVAFSLLVLHMIN